MPFSGFAFFLRPFPYTLFLLPFTTDWTVWLVPVAQGLVAAYAVRRALSAAGLALRPAPFLAVILALALLTSLPVQAGMIMPDLFTGPLILMAYAVYTGWAERSRTGRLFDVAVLAGMTMVHLSHLAILGALAALMLLWSLVRRRGLRAVLLGLCAPLLLAAGTLMAANAVLMKHPVLSPSSPLFLLARLIGDGPARDYLAEACPERGYLLCGKLDTLDRSAPGFITSDYFLWHPDGARHAFGDTPRFLAEASEINRATIASRPLDVARHMAINAATLLVSPQIDIILTNPVKPWTRQFFSRFGQPVYTAFMTSLQMAQAFPRAALNAVQLTVLVLSLLALGWVLATRAGRLGGRQGGLLAVLALGLMLNAAVAGGLSAVHPRYQNRVAWLLPLAAIAALLAVQPRRTEEPAASPALASGRPAA
ncbi:hypothetical protein [Azospirillum thermophilum]|uniref:Glycosyltransferase RgtA/B/C/D-like domain-containing protein n=1 Tax=Azospirillum thermophilum TaxID=2202148 RepID=A0A2S2D009_9PROT|nr:hypothetical protein [Azospirillum thermophilum]AWK90101.1 hypothetical protein DEW08_29395 [Azospirillum thermophilum]